jgi:hypothetical protein
MNINEVSPKIAGVIGTRWLKLQTSGWNGVSQHFQIPYKQSHPGEIVWDRRYESWYIFHQQDAIWVCLKMSYIYIYIPSGYLTYLLNMAHLQMIFPTRNLHL